MVPATVEREPDEFLPVDDLAGLGAKATGQEFASRSTWRRGGREALISLLTAWRSTVK